MEICAEAARCRYMHGKLGDKPILVYRECSTGLSQHAVSIERLLTIFPKGRHQAAYFGIKGIPPLSFKVGRNDP